MIQRKVRSENVEYWELVDVRRVNGMKGINSEGEGQIQTGNFAQILIDVYIGKNIPRSSGQAMEGIGITEPRRRECPPHKVRRRLPHYNER